MVMVILLDSSSLIDFEPSFTWNQPLHKKGWSDVKEYLKDRLIVNPEQSRYLNELSIKDEKLNVSINTKNIKDFVKSTQGTIAAGYVDPILKKVLNDTTKIKLPINDILFSGKFLNELQSPRKLSEAQIERNKMKPNTGLDTVNAQRPAGEKRKQGGDEKETRTL